MAKICKDCRCKCFKVEDLPTITKEGMTASAWTLITSGGLCCAKMTLTYNTPPAWVLTDGGPVMTYDKTISVTREYYYSGYMPLSPGINPRNCPTILTGHFLAPSSGGDPGYTTIPIEPSYSGCCSDVQVVNTRTTSIREWGGLRFVVKSRPSSIELSIQLRSTECPGRTPDIADRYVITSRYNYEAAYTYASYGQVRTITTNSSSQPCWGGNTDVTTGSDFVLGDFSGTGVFVQFCRRLILDEDDWLAATEYIFDSTSTIIPFDIIGVTTCNVLQPDCDACATYATSFCIDTTPQITEPSVGFCTPLGIGTVNYTSTRKTCSQHKYQLIDDADGSVIGCFVWSPSAYDLITCSIVFTALELNKSGTTAGSGYGAGCGGGPYPDFGGTCDVLTFTCDNCPTSSGTTTYTITTFDCRLKGATEAIACSGYIPQSVCIDFIPWTLVVEMP